MLYVYPKQAYFGRVLPKTKIYQHATPTSTIKALFVCQVEQIKWTHKLSAATLNIASESPVTEIQVMRLRLKGQEIDSRVLSTIDSAIPFPLIFELERQNITQNQPAQVKMCAAYKVMNDGQATTLQGANGKGYYLTSRWQLSTEQSQSLPVATSLQRLYEYMLAPMLPIEPRKGEPMVQTITRAIELEAAQNALAKLQNKLDREKQFNRKIELNAQKRSLLSTLSALS